MKNYNVRCIDNFLEESYFKDLSGCIMDNEEFRWKYSPYITSAHKKKATQQKEPDYIFYMVHALLIRTKTRIGKTSIIMKENDPKVVRSPFLEILDPVLKKCEQIGLNNCVRAKCNMYPYTETLSEHEFHIDGNFPHTAAILSLNTCNGYTIFETGEKVDSVANRLSIVDGTIFHASTNTTNAKARFNINFNFSNEPI